MNSTYSDADATDCCEEIVEAYNDLFGGSLQDDESENYRAFFEGVDADGNKVKNSTIVNKIRENLGEDFINNSKNEGKDFWYSSGALCGIRNKQLVQFWKDEIELT